MSKNDVLKLGEKHIPDCLMISKFFEKYEQNIKTLADFGTGGGLPAIPIAIKYKNLDVFAVDATAKKVKFVETVKEELNLTNLFPICTRIEDFEKREYFDVVTTRAVAGLSTVLEYCTPFVRKNGYIVAYKSKTADEELKEAKNALKLLNLKFIEKINVSDTADNERYLLIFQKTKETYTKYPRKNNLPRKNPL